MRSWWLEQVFYLCDMATDRIDAGMVRTACVDDKGHVTVEGLGAMMWSHTVEWGSRWLQLNGYIRQETGRPEG